MRALKPDRELIGDADTSRLSFLDLLSCALGASILLFVVFLDFGAQGLPPQPGQRFVWYELQWQTGTARVAVRLVDAGGEDLTVPLEGTRTDSGRITRPAGRELRFLVVARAASSPAEPALMRVVASGDAQRLERLHLQAKYVSDERWARWSQDRPLEPLEIHGGHGSWQSQARTGFSCRIEFDGAWHRCSR
jgi:hypothetical protein